MLFPAAPPVESRKALLVLDIQNDFLAPDGKLPVPNVSDFLPRLPNLVKSFRQRGPVIWVRTEYEQPRPTFLPEIASFNVLLQEHLSAEVHLKNGEARTHRRGRSRAANDTQDVEAFLADRGDFSHQRPCLPKTSGAEMPPVLTNAVDLVKDLQFVKSHYSAFVDANFLLQLRTRLVTHIYVCGSLSNITVYATVMDAVGHGVEVTLIEDCLGFRDQQCHVEAMRQMADTMGAEGVDYQELMDDLAGLLGDVIREEDFGSHFQISLPPVRSRRSDLRQQRSREKVVDWISTTENARKRSSRILTEEDGVPPVSHEDSGFYDSHPCKTQPSKTPSKQGTPEPSPPRKRSTGDFGEVEEKISPRVAPRPLMRRAPSEHTSDTNRAKASRPRLRQARTSRESTNSSVTRSALKAMSKSPTEVRASPEIPSEGETTTSRNVSSPLLEQNMAPEPRRMKKQKKTNDLLRPTDIVGEGDCRVVELLLPGIEADEAFSDLKSNVKWQRMYHRTGEVPRLVAVQGKVHQTISSAYDEPIYRHPADESPPLVPFNNVVTSVCTAAEKAVGHTLNHVLIQYYRNSTDNISEHSDKTLDIVRGSSIVNLSLGAQRTMTLRNKRSAGTTAMESETGRTTQRVPLTHNSLFILGPTTNRHWLHAIRADKRPATEKFSEELAYNEERISLTFRHIGTFTNESEGIIWGQGATSKTRETAKKILKGQEAEVDGDKMIKAFGMENHMSVEWDWDRWYGEGFDVVNFHTKEHETP